MKKFFLLICLFTCVPASGSVKAPCAHVGDPIIHGHNEVCEIQYWHDRIPYVTPEGRSVGEATERLKRLWFTSGGTFGIPPYERVQEWRQKNEPTIR